VRNEARNIARRKQQIGPERHDGFPDSDLLPLHAGTGSEMAMLVELGVVRQMHLRHDAKKLAAMDDERRVVEPSGVTQGRADEEQRQQIPRGLDENADLALDRLEQDVLQQQIVDRIARERQFGKTATATPRSWHTRTRCRIAFALAAGSARVQRVAQAATRAKP